MLLLLFTALSLGFLGSFHCIGMCGPIALALPIHNLSFAAKSVGILIYNLGRIVTYTLIGFVFGLLGSNFALAGTQQTISIVMGLCIILFVLIPKKSTIRLLGTSYLFKGYSKIKNALGSLLHQRNNSSLFLIGLLNGLLPCGLIYLAIAGATAVGSTKLGMLFMIAFGLGTLPAMFSIASFGQFITINIRNYIRRAMPVFILTMGLLLVLRGMNLGVPYISPKLSQNEQGTTSSCCQRHHDQKK